MKILLNIASSEWICDDAAKAAKVMDLLNSFTPVERDWDNHEQAVLIARSSYRHDISIKQIGEKTVIVKSLADAFKLRPAPAK